MTRATAAAASGKTNGDTTNGSKEYAAQSWKNPVFYCNVDLTLRYIGVILG